MEKKPGKKYRALKIIIVVIFGLIVLSYFVPVNKEKEAFNKAIIIVSSYLKCPKTSVFCKYKESQIFILTDRKQYQINGWVDSENTFSAMIRGRFMVVLTCDLEVVAIWIEPDLIVGDYNDFVFDPVKN